jgi:catechol 2,3-dioxygenase
MKARVRGIRSIEIAVADPERAARFYREVWHLEEVERVGATILLRGTAAYHHVLAISQAAAAPALTRITYDAPSRPVVDRLYDQVWAKTDRCEPPHPVRSAGGGYGFGFADPDGWTCAVIADSADHKDIAPKADRPTKITHVNLNTPDIPRASEFLVEALGFRLIDETAALIFFNADSADHSSMVLSKTPIATVNHVAFEMSDLDSVMRGAGRMKDHGYPIEWGVGRHGPSGNVFAYFAGPEEFPIEYTSEVRQLDDSYEPHGSNHWRWPPGRADEWGVTNPHTPRWKRIQTMFPPPKTDFRLV